MAGSVVGSIAGGVASAGVSKLLNKGGKSVNIPETDQMAPPVKLFGTGLNVLGSTSTLGKYEMTRLPAIQSLLDESRAALLRGGSDVEGIMSQVRPGFGALTNSRVQAVRDARDSSISNLRDNLARRRVLGSSFGQDAVSRGDAEFAKAEGEARSQSLLEEIDLTSRLIQERTAYLTSAAEKEINQANLEFQMASGLISGTQTVLNSNADVIGKMAMANAAGEGAFADRIGGSVTDWLGEQTWWPF